MMVLKKIGVCVFKVALIIMMMVKHLMVLDLFGEDLMVAYNQLVVRLEFLIPNHYMIFLTKQKLPDGLQKKRTSYKYLHPEL